MDRFVYQNGLSSFIAPMPHHHHHPLTTSMIAAKFGMMNKPKTEKKSHSEAESRRRKRINDHLTTLRSILPSKVKTDKATLLMETVQHVKELQRKFREVGDKMKKHIPTETDSVNVSACENENMENDDNSMVVKATVCCEDRPELNKDMIQLLKSFQGKITRTEMVNVGGRIKLIMTLKLGIGKSEIGRLRRGLLAVAENRVSGNLVGIGNSCNSSSDKRGRFVMSNGVVDGGSVSVAGVGVCNLSF